MQGCRSLVHSQGRAAYRWMCQGGGGGRGAFHGEAVNLAALLILYAVTLKLMCSFFVIRSNIYGY